MSQQFYLSDYNLLLEMKDLPHILRITTIAHLDDCIKLNKHHQGKAFEFRKYFQLATINAWNNNDIVGDVDRNNLSSVCKENKESNKEITALKKMNEQNSKEKEKLEKKVKELEEIIEIKRLQTSSKDER
ncbi:11754_t:CDS:2 [Cetraspora pellucida]|uniref:11754_t:CDS:1 n=1 Tax=Cetraspora pellucida TaxID=1433469 RepID=A0ACA9KQQ5_9GLOM|nr:11754_t:CDS:2 [Cetraspora pellucida]